MILEDENVFSFVRFSEQDRNGYLNKREGETKLGEKLSTLKDAKYVVLGIAESIGPRANNGRGGAENGFSAFLNVFLNMQSNESLIGDKVHILGEIIPPKNEIEDLRLMVSKLDQKVLQVLDDNITENQIPIVIGGGHNNAFPLIKFSFQRFGEKINVVNLDAHADYRLLEGRHSGNSFSYAYNEGLIHKYFVMGLHRRYNSQQILDDLKRDKHFFTFNEDYLVGKRNYNKDFELLKEGFNQVKDYLGIELDLDVIRNMPSSASSPIGINVSTARKYLRIIPMNNKIAYLHLPEGAPNSAEEQRIVGKTLAYLVSDFIETCNSSNTF